MQIKMYVQSVDLFGKLKGQKYNQTWIELTSSQVRCLATTPDNLSAIEYAELIVEYFNSTLTENEHPRKLIWAEEMKK